MSSSHDKPTLALALGGGGACGLAHIGVLEVLESDGISIDGVVGTSMGGLIGALSAMGLRVREILELARSFRFPRGFVLGRIVEWDSIFRSAAEAIEGVSFDELETPLMVTATNIERGDQIVLRRGALLPAVRATCAVPGVLPPIRIDGRWLVDGSLVNLLPVDVAWMGHPDVVVAVNVGVTEPRDLGGIHRSISPFLMGIGKLVPNPATAKVCFEILARAAEITVARQATLATAMTGPELLVEPRLPDMGIRDFDRLDEAVEAGRRAAREALPALRTLLDAPPSSPSAAASMSGIHFDPVCGMVIDDARARATAAHGAAVYRFCSTNCHDLFARNPRRYLESMAFTGTATPEGNGP